MTFSGVVSRNTSPTASLPSAVTSLNATGTTLGAPLAQVASVCPVCQEALSGEESAEAPPAAEEARRFRGSVPTAGRGSGWEPADTTVSAEEHAKKITTQMGGDLWSGRRGSNSLPGIPRMAVAIRRSPASPLDLTRFAQVEAASSPVLRHIPKRIPHPVGWGILFVIAHRFCCACNQRYVAASQRYFSEVRRKSLPTERNSCYSTLPLKYALIIAAISSIG